MEFYHLQDYFEATRHYSGIAAMMGNLVAADEVSAAVNRLHNAMSKIDIYGVVNVLECHCENAAAMEHFVRQWLDIDIRLLIERMNGNKQAFRKADAEMVEAYRFAILMSDVLHEADARIKERMEAEWAQIDNENALSDYQAFNDGFYGEIPLRDFLMRHIIDGVSLDIAVRRVRYLIGHCPDLAVRISLHKIIEEYKKQHIANDIAEMRRVAAQPLTWQADPTPEAQPSLSVQATEKDDAAKNISITKIDADRLGSFFNAKFKGNGNNYNYFDDMIKDIQAIKVTKELAMIAVMIYDCRRYFIQRPSTFAAWLREFFEMIGRDCPKDHHKNKYTPNERIKRTFHYLS